MSMPFLSAVGHNGEAPITNEDVSCVVGGHQEADVDTAQTMLNELFRGLCGAVIGVANGMILMLGERQVLDTLGRMLVRGESGSRSGIRGSMYKAQFRTCS